MRLLTKQNRRGMEKGREVSRLRVKLMYRCTFVIIALRRRRQEDQEFEVSLCYIARSCLKTNTLTSNNNKHAFL